VKLATSYTYYLESPNNALSKLAILTVGPILAHHQGDHIMTIAAVLLEKGNHVISVTPHTTVQEIAEIIASKRIGAVLVLEPGNRLAGIVSERDVVKAVAARPEGIYALQAHQIMTRDVTTAAPETTIEEAMEMMDRGYFRHLPVIEASKLVGIISIRDVVKARIKRHEHEVDHMRSYIHGRA
jgi:CBS domain-containing protein